MTSRWAGLAVCLIVAAVAGASFISTGCDPCASCSSTRTKPTGTPTPAPNACLPASSLSVLVQGKDVTSYLPQGNWGGGSASVNVVPIETSSGIGTGGSPTSITVGSAPNSCASNSTTGQTVCIGNNTDVYLINGSTLTSTLTSGATSTEGFSGGDLRKLWRGRGRQYQPGVDHDWPGVGRPGWLPIPRPWRHTRL